MHPIPSLLVVTNDTKARKTLGDELRAANEETERIMNGGECVLHDEVPALLDEPSVDILPVDDVMHNELPWQVCEEPVHAKSDREECVRMCFFFQNQISEKHEESLDEEEIEFPDGCERDMQPLFDRGPITMMELARARLCFFFKNQTSKTHQESLDEEDIEFPDGCERDMQPLFDQSPVMKMELEEFPFAFRLLTNRTDIKKPVSMIYKALYPDVSRLKKAAPHSLQN